MPERVGPNTKVDLTSFRLNCDRLLRPDHPFRNILRNVPNEISAGELALRIDDWLAILEA